MTLKVLSIECLRNLTRFQTALHPHLNVVTGVNGSGKTSVLEAIYLLSCGRSFRAREITSLITEGKTALSLSVKTTENSVVGIQKSLNMPTVMRINQETCTAASELARFLPTQIFYQDIFQIIDAGPTVRRSLLDWGLFHVKQHYHELWKNYRRALKQRNSLLRQKAPTSEFLPWDCILSDLAEEIDCLRLDYLQALNAQFKEVLASLTEIPCTLQYYKGWDRRAEKKSLKTVLQESFLSDMQNQYTRYGCHHAELIFVAETKKIKHYLSRGQQKIVLFALKIAQAKLLAQGCLFLMDDLFAELDDIHSERLIACLLQTQGQFVVTSHTAELMSRVLSPEQFLEIQLNSV